jgi:hypothetical protein
VGSHTQPDHLDADEGSAIARAELSLGGHKPKHVSGVAAIRANTGATACAVNEPSVGDQPLASELVEDIDPCPQIAVPTTM